MDIVVNFTDKYLLSDAIIHLFLLVFSVLESQNSWKRL